MDGHQETVGNFKVEPPGLFSGRGDHPKQRKMKKRVKAKDIKFKFQCSTFVNIGLGSKYLSFQSSLVFSIILNTI
jgi:DNA topoisomerase IB